MSFLQDFLHKMYRDKKIRPYVIYRIGISSPKFQLQNLFSTLVGSYTRFRHFKKFNGLKYELKLKLTTYGTDFLIILLRFNKNQGLFSRDFSKVTKIVSGEYRGLFFFLVNETEFENSLWKTSFYACRKINFSKQYDSHLFVTQFFSLSE